MATMSYRLWRCKGNVSNLMHDRIRINLFTKAMSTMLAAIRIVLYRACYTRFRKSLTMAPWVPLLSTSSAVTRLITGASLLASEIRRRWL